MIGTTVEVDDETWKMIKPRAGMEDITVSAPLELFLGAIFEEGC